MSIVNGHEPRRSRLEDGMHAHLLPEGRTIHAHHDMTGKISHQPDGRHGPRDQMAPNTVAFACCYDFGIPGIAHSLVAREGQMCEGCRES